MTDAHHKKSDAVANELAMKIIRGEITPGEKLRQDGIARAYGVSQATVREALLRLSFQGLTISLPRRGMCVAGIDQHSVGELQAMRSALEPLALQFSVPHLSKEQITEVERLCVACDAAETAEMWEEANRDFHNSIVAGCTMPRLVSEIHNLQLLYARHFYAQYARKWRKRDDPDHAAILAAIKEKDTARAVQVLQRHLARLA